MTDAGISQQRPRDWSDSITTTQAGNDYASNLKTSPTQADVDTNSRNAGTDATTTATATGNSVKTTSNLQKTRGVLGLHPTAPIDEEHDAADHSTLWWSKVRLALREPFAEFFGVMIMVLFGDGSVAQVLLSAGQKSAPGADGYGNYQSISWGWGLGVMLGWSYPFSGRPLLSLVCRGLCRGRQRCISESSHHVYELPASKATLEKISNVLSCATPGRFRCCCNYLCKLHQWNQRG